MGPGKSGKKLMLLVGEVDSIGEATFGYALKVKNLPDFPLVMTSDLHKSFEKVFKSTVTLGGYVPNAHSIVIATFVIDLNGIPAVQEMCIMLTSPESIPFENSFERSTGRNACRAEAILSEAVAVQPSHREANCFGRFDRLI